MKLVILIIFSQPVNVQFTINHKIINDIFTEPSLLNQCYIVPFKLKIIIQYYINNNEHIYSPCNFNFNSTTLIIAQKN